MTLDPTPAEVAEWFDKYSNWDRWGASDSIGTLNYVTGEKRRQAVTSVVDGLPIACGRPVDFEAAPDVPTQFARRFMEKTGEAPDALGAAESILTGTHGGCRTHLDSPAHMFWGGKMYNGFPATAVSSEHGATVGGVDGASGGIVTRGVLLDIAHLRGKRWLDPSEEIHPEDLDRAEEEQGVRVESGDGLLVRTGHTAHRMQAALPMGHWPGLHARCIPWLHEREISLLGGDSANDVSPNEYEEVKFPVHRVSLVAMGLWLIDHLDLEALSIACKAAGRWNFLWTVAPLNLPGCTGSPVNPVAIL